MNTVVCQMVTRHDIKDKKTIGTMSEAYPHLILDKFSPKDIEADDNLAPLPSSSLVVAVVINGKKRETKYAVKWALDKFAYEGKATFRMMHVRSRINSVPTPYDRATSKHARNVSSMSGCDHDPGHLFSSDQATSFNFYGNPEKGSDVSMF